MGEGRVSSATTSIGVGKRAHHECHVNSRDYARIAGNNLTQYFWRCYLVAITPDYGTTNDGYTSKSDVDIAK
jgi:hypothetical protein